MRPKIAEQVKNKQNAKWIISEEDADRRGEIWDVLYNNGAAYLWHPRDVDRALNHSPSWHDFSAICFVVANIVDGHPTRTDAELEEVIHSGSRRLMQPFWETCVRRIANRIDATGGVGLIDDGLEVAIDCAAELVPNYRPFRVNDGHRVSQGFLAYLSAFSRRMWRSIFERSVQRRMVDIDRVNSIAIIGQQDAMTVDCVGAVERERIVKALRAVLTTSERYEFFEMAVYGRGLRAYAEKAGRPRATVSRKLSRPILRDLQAQLGDLAGRLQSSDFGRVARAFAALMPSEGFHRLIPCPRAPKLMEPAIAGC